MSDAHITIPKAGTVLIKKPFDGIWNDGFVSECVLEWSKRFAWTCPNEFANDTMGFVHDGLVMPVVFNQQKNSFRFSIAPTSAGIEAIMETIDKDRLI